MWGERKKTRWKGQVIKGGKEERKIECKTNGFRREMEGGRERVWRERGKGVEDSGKLEGEPRM